MALALICTGLICLQSYIHNRGQGSLHTELLSLQLPFLYSVGPLEKEPYPIPDTNEYEALTPDDIEITDIDEGVGEGVLIELLSIDERPESTVDLSGSEPKILIYHTHTTEAYRQTSASKYIESGDWRTHNNAKNIVAVGERLADILRERYGISVIHDITDHEPPKLDTSYSRSVVTMQYYKDHYPSIAMYIDVHRDAYTNVAEGSKDFVVIDGKECARLMFVVGTGEGATGTGFKEMPDFASNYALAKRLTEKLAEIDPKLVRNIRVKTGRYNQHISSQCLLVEVGHNSNTLEQALNAVDLLADAIAAVAKMQPAPKASSTASPKLFP